MTTKLVTLIFAVILFADCGTKQKQTEGNTKSASHEVVKKKEGKMANHPGKMVYNSVCLVCHMADGSGVPGMHPPLIQTDMVNGDKEQLIRIVLEGMSGEIEVNGEKYNSVMPPHAHLSDKEIADVLTFIRGSFGNDASEILPEEVARLRGETTN